MAACFHQLTLAIADWASASDGLQPLPAAERTGAFDPNQTSQLAQSRSSNCAKRTLATNGAVALRMSLPSRSSIASPACLRDSRPALLTLLSEDGHRVLFGHLVLAALVAGRVHPAIRSARTR